MALLPPLLHSQPAALRFLLVAFSLCLVLTRMNALPCSKRLGHLLPSISSLKSVSAFVAAPPGLPSSPAWQETSNACFVEKGRMFARTSMLGTRNSCTVRPAGFSSWFPTFPRLARSVHDGRRGRFKPGVMTESAGSEGSAAPSKPKETKGKVSGKKRQRDPKKAQLDEERARISADLKKEFGMDGVMAVHKPANWTSFDVVAKVRSELGKMLRNENANLTPKQCRVKVGHGGTLDPMATGVLVLGVGSGTKLMDEYTKGSKCYEAVGLFGFETDTGDAEGVQTGDAIDFSHVTEEALQGALAKFQGEISQVPPVYSAIKKDGKKAYELARKGIEVEMEARQVMIYKLELTKPFRETSPCFHLAIECGGGTYIRSLVRDIARELGGAAHMQQLIRTKQGEFALGDCLEAQHLNAGPAILAALHAANQQNAERRGLAPEPNPAP